MTNIFGPKYSLVGIDGNAYSIMGYVQHAMREQNFSKQQIKEYSDEAMSGDYNNLLSISNDYIGMCNESHDEATKYDVEVKQQEYDVAVHRVRSLERELRCAQIECEIRKKKLDHAQMFARKNE